MLLSKRSYILISAILFSATLCGQTATQYQLELKKDFISWAWNAGIKTTLATGKQSKLSFTDNFISKLLRQSVQGDKWRDENNLALFWESPISPILNTRSIIKSRFFSDENTSQKFSKHLAAQEFNFHPHKKISFRPAFGVVLEEAFDKQDQGWYTNIGVKISKLDMGGYLYYTDLNAVIRSFPDRKNLDYKFYTGWTREFSQFATDSIRVGYELTENRYYINSPMDFEEENPQEQVIINSRFLFNQLQYNLGDHSFLAVLTNFRDRSIDQNNAFLEIPNRRKEFSLTNQIQYLLSLKAFQLQSGIVFSQIKTDNPDLRTDINNLQTAFTNSLRFNFSSNNRLWSNFSFTKMEYNTPITVDASPRSTDILANREDRDEIRFIFSNGFMHRFSPFFSVTLNGRLYLFHQIYLRSGRSQNNSWNRIYQLASAFDHQISSKIRHGQGLKILANFTVFDFDEIFTTARSFVFRKLVYNDSLNIQLTEKISLITIFRWESQDNGTFFKENFSQLITKELSSQSYNISLQHQNVLGLKVTYGISWFFRDEWLFNQARERNHIRKFSSFSPRLSVLYLAKNNLLFFLTYSPNRSNNATRSLSDKLFSDNIEYFTSGNITLRYTF